MSTLIPKKVQQVESPFNFEGSSGTPSRLKVSNQCLLILLLPLQRIPLQRQNHLDSGAA